MIFYLTQYNTISQFFNRKFIVSQAGINRSNEIIQSLGNDAMIINWALPLGNEKYESFIETIPSGHMCFYPAFSGEKKFRYRDVIRGTVKYLRNNIHRGDIIICYNAHFISSFILIKAMIPDNVKIIYEIEEFYSVSYYGGIIRHLLHKLSEKYMLNKSDAFLVVNKYLATLLPPKKPYLISFGYVIHHESPLENNFLPNIPQIVYCGRLDDDGGITVLLESIQYLNVKCRIVITGDGPLRNKVREYHNINSLVILDYKGFVSQQEIDYLQNTATVCVNTLRVNCPFSKVSFPSKVYQYLSYGNIVISSRTPIVEYLNTYLPVIFFYEQDSSLSLANVINSILINNKVVDRKKNKTCFDIYHNKMQTDLCDFIHSL